MQIPSRSSILNNKSGFTLIELAIVLVIVGVVISIVASVLPSLLQSSKKKKAQALLEKADYTLQGYSIVNGRLPFADSGTDGDEDTNTYVGNLPYRTLGFTSGDDVWGNRIKYAVYDALTVTDPNTFCSTLSGVTDYTDSSKIHTTDKTTSQITNQAYIIVSGGQKDIDNDGADGFFDGSNEGNDLQFDDPTKMEFHGDPSAIRYDDLMRVFSLPELVQKNCSGGGSAGGGGGGGGTSAGENTYPSGCSNGVDDDGDGFTDCDDQDCFNVGTCGAGGSDVSITTSSIPPGVVNSDYSVIFQATGGMTPYEWTLESNGGFSDFFLHTYTGQLSGTLSQCPNTYTISVRITDSDPDNTDPSPSSFSLQVTTDLVVSRTSGSGTNIAWDSPVQQETFTANGGHVGDISWSLDSGGATGFTVTSSGTDMCTISKNGATAAGSYTFTLNATDSTCTADNTAQIILSVTVTSSGTGTPTSAYLMGHWKFDETEGTTAEDSSGNNNDGTLSNMDDSDWVSGKDDNALDFDGSNDSVAVSHSSSLDITDTITVSAWIKPSVSLSGYKRIVEKHYSSSWYFGTSSGANSISVYINGSQRASTATNVYSIGAWSHVAFTYDKDAGGTDEIKIYLNGVQRATGDYSTAIGSDTEEITIGKWKGGTSWTFNGIIDDVRIYNKVLTASEIYEFAGGIDSGLVGHWKFDESSGSIAADSSGNEFDGTLTNMYTSTCWVAGKIGNGLEFDGSNDYVNAGNSGALTPENITITAWANPSRLDTWDGIVTNKPNAANGINLQTGTAQRIAALVGNGSSYTYVRSSTLPAVDTWHHIAITHNSGNNNNVLYVNGTKEIERTFSLSYSLPVNTIIGRFYTSSLPFQGVLDDVRIYSRVLSEEEISTLNDMGS